MAEAELLLSKGDFARLINVTPGRVSQMISEGKIGADALEGEGRYARIKANLARRQIADRTDIGQRHGNGLFTQLDAPPPATTDRQPMRAPLADPTTAAIAAERLRSLQLKNEREAEDRLAEQGRYVVAAQVQASMNKMAAQLLTIFEGGLADLAAQVAAAHGLVQRDVLHQLRGEFRKVRLKALETLRRDMAGMAPLVADEIADASDPAAGEA